MNTEIVNDKKGYILPEVEELFSYSDVAKVFVRINNFDGGKVLGKGRLIYAYCLSDNRFYYTDLPLRNPITILEPVGGKMQFKEKI